MPTHARRIGGILVDTMPSTNSFPGQSTKIIDGTRRSMRREERTLRDLGGIGPSIEKNLRDLGIESVAELARASPDSLFKRLAQKEGRAQDPCVLDTFRCAVAQARNPDLPAEQCAWWWWSRQRKQDAAQRPSRNANTR